MSREIKGIIHTENPAEHWSFLPVEGSTTTHKHHHIITELERND